MRSQVHGLGLQATGFCSFRDSVRKGSRVARALCAGSVDLCPVHEAGLACRSLWGHAMHPSSADVALKHQEGGRLAQVQGEAVGVSDRRAGPCPRPRGGSEGRTVTVRVALKSEESPEAGPLGMGAHRLEFPTSLSAFLCLSDAFVMVSGFSLSLPIGRASPHVSWGPWKRCAQCTSLL